MDTLTTIALVGTARQASAEIATGTPIDDLLSGIPDIDRERKLLLAAGMRAVYQQAGKIAEPIPEAPEPAPPESLAACSSTIQGLLEELLKDDYEDLLPEALARVQQAGLYLPAELLPQVLDIRSRELRPALVPVIGERGRWLGRFNPAWSWAVEELSGPRDTLPEDAETIWQQGTSAQRVALLRRLRHIDPARARTWLEGVWKQEKSALRNELLETLSVQLGPEDEPFLEKVLDDRTVSVRTTAASLLARLPGSAFMQRMQARAESLFEYKAGKLACKPPEVISKDWERDGILPKPPEGTGAREWWLTQLLTVIPLAFWQTRYGLAPAELIAAASTKWRSAILEGWMQSAMLRESSNWAIPLWDWFTEQKKVYSTQAQRQKLLALMPPREAEQRVCQLLTDDGQQKSRGWGELLEALPRPWSEDFSKVYLQAMRKYTETLKTNTNDYHLWQESLGTALVALPTACFAEALEEITVPDNKNWQTQYWRQGLQKFTEMLRMRQRIIKEIV